MTGVTEHNRTGPVDDAVDLPTPSYGDADELAEVLHPADAEEASSGRLARLRARQAALVARAEQLAERAQAERGRHGSVDAVFEMVERDGEVGGGIIAGALAYRLFIWLLPLALVVVAGLGIAADASSQSPGEAANSAGLASLVSSSVASAANSSARWYALLVGIPVLLYATRSVLRALIGAHRLVWTDLRAAAPKPTLGATVKLLAALVACFVLAGLVSTARHDSVLLGIFASILIALPYAGIWLLVSMRLPHREADWRALVPGALLFGFGIEILNAVAVYIRAVLDREAGHVRSARHRGSAPARALLPGPDRRLCSGPERDAVGAANRPETAGVCGLTR